MLTKAELVSYPSREPLHKRLRNYTVDENGCWNWNLKKDRCGYGRFKINLRSLGAHKVSYVFHCGDVGDGFVVMHSCDNPACINPEHLSIGTQKENVQDSIDKGRFHGERDASNRVGVIGINGHESIFLKSFSEADNYPGVTRSGLHKRVRSDYRRYRGYDWYKIDEFFAISCPATL